ncbi:MAG: peptidase M28, partial [Pedobacter sp.]|nr:peptidase M28 [Pedobacter sp.]
MKTKQNILLFLVAMLSCSSLTFAQSKDPIIEKMVKEANENSQLEKLAHELLDQIGPRLVGTPQ